MANYKISGVWKDENNVITQYAFHTVGIDGISRATKKSKAEAVRLLETAGNSAITWLWNYTRAQWTDGQAVTLLTAQTEILTVRS